MRIILSSLSVSLLFLAGAAFAGSGQVSGTVKFRSGTPYSNHSSDIEIHSEGGYQKAGTDSNGRYSTSVRGCYVNKIFIRGDLVWSGSKDACPSATIDLTAPN